MPVPKDSALFINRELSWLEFNRRVLELSKEKTVPLGEQLRFTAIYGSNLDEFFMIRVGALYDQTLLKSSKTENKTGMTAQQQLHAIMPKVKEIQARCDNDVAKLYANLKAHQFEKVDFEALDKNQENFWKTFFMEELFPVLSPQIIDRRHPFPFLRNRELYVGTLLKDGKNEKLLFGVIPISSHFERVIWAPNENVLQFALVEELVLHFAHLAFGKAAIVEKTLFRVTRNADINVEEGMFDHDIDYRVVMGELLKKRRKLAAVRLQFWGKPRENIKKFICDKLLLPVEQCFVQKAPLELSFLHRVANRLKAVNDSALFYPVSKPIAPPLWLHLYKEVLHRDVLIQYPFQSFRPFIQMLNEAAEDPDVMSIKMTLYRVADDSKVIDALIAAAENGKEVVTIVELRARFDEQNNIDWSRQLEAAGCTVIYGFTDFKVHSKLLLITKKSKYGFTYISQVGTGNYNEKTSEQYTDLSYLTSNQELGEEIAGVFNDLAVEKLTEEVSQLIVAPLCFKTKLLNEMQNESEYQKQGGQGKIFIKCNSLSDKDIIETLSMASQAGVQVQMVVRGICCLQAGLPGYSKNIEVRSLVGRYLEHSRIYAFGEGERQRIYIASGDFLTRNTEKRVEVGVRIQDETTKGLLRDILDMQWRDNSNARVMQPDGSYVKVRRPKGRKKYDSQFEMYGYLENRIAQMKPYEREEAPKAGNVPQRAPGAVRVCRRKSPLRRRLRRRRKM